MAKATEGAEKSAQGKAKGLRWNGLGFLPLVPARDLSAEEVERYGGRAALLGSGAYEEIDEAQEVSDDSRR